MRGRLGEVRGEGWGGELAAEVRVDWRNIIAEDPSQRAVEAA